MPAAYKRESIHDPELHPAFRAQGWENLLILIIAAGSGTRWGNHKSVPKHLAPVLGTTVLERLVEQFRPHGRVVVVGPPEDPRYQFWGADTVSPKIAPYDADKFLSSSPHWNPAGRTVVVYGDCFLTERAVSAIVSSTPRLTLYGRWGASSITGTPWGECFAYSFLPQHQDAFRNALNDVQNWQMAGFINRSGGWETFHRLNGANARTVRRKAFREGWAQFVDIDDWSDDFDFPADYDRWMQLRAARGLPTVLPRLSVAIMAHPDRAAWVEHISQRLAGPVSVEWDRGKGVWDTARRGWLCSDPTVYGHHLLLQDDVLPCRDLVPGICNAIATAPPLTPMAFYTMRYRVIGPRTDYYLALQAEGKRWFVDTQSLSGQAICLPAPMIRDMIIYADALPMPQDDLRVRRFCHVTKHQVWQSVPSLVQHRTDANPTLVPGHDFNRPTTRDALAFIGEDRSALEVFPDAVHA